MAPDSSLTAEWLCGDLDGENSEDTVRKKLRGQWRQPARSGRYKVLYRCIVTSLLPLCARGGSRHKGCRPDFRPTSTVLRGCAVRARMSACLGTALVSMALLYGNYFAATGAASPSCGETLGKVAVVLGLFF